MKVYLFACIEKNIGDDLFVKILCERYPNVDFVITSRANYGSLKDIPNLIFSDLLEKWIRVSSLGQNNIIKALAAKIIQLYYTYRLPQYEVGVFIVGNAFKNTKYTGWKQSRWIRERIRLVDRFYIISTNFGPFSEEQWKNDFDKIFSEMKDVCFRDNYSYELFSQLPNVRFAPDAVFTLGMREHNKNKNVIISLIDCSFQARSEKLKKAASIYEQKIADTINLLLTKGYRITLLNSNKQQDRPACDRILNKVNPTNISVLDYDGNLDKIFELYENSSYVIGTRLHTIILGFLFKLTVVPIVYDIKVTNLLGECSFDQSFFDITKLKTVSERDIVNALEKNGYLIPKIVLNKAQEQFIRLDKEFAKE